MVEGGGLENRCTARYEGFESLTLRQSFFPQHKNFKTSTYGEIYNLAFKMFINNPFTGVGINNYKYVCNNYEIYNNLMKNYNCASHPHNIYLQWLTEGGVIVFLFFLIYLIYLFIFIFKNNNNYVLKTISVTSLIILLILIHQLRIIIVHYIFYQLFL